MPTVAEVKAAEANDPGEAGEADWEGSEPRSDPLRRRSEHSLRGQPGLTLEP